MRFLFPVLIALFFNLNVRGDDSPARLTRCYGGMQQELANNAHTTKDPIVKVFQVVGELTASFVSVEIAQNYLPPEYIYTKSFFYLLAGACGIKSLWTASTTCTEARPAPDLDDSVV